MKLFFSSASPYVRMVMAVAHEAGLTDRIEKLPAAANPVTQDQSIVAHNPTGKVPTLLTDEGLALYDSRVICEYLDAQGTGAKLFPAEGAARWKALVLLAAANGLLDAALLARYETAMRPEALRWDEWVAGQKQKIAKSLAEFEAKWMETLSGPVTIGPLAVACALGYLDLRFADFGWRDQAPKLAAWYADFAQRPSMTATVPEG
jgi:glutathione S-transferase